MTEYDVVVLGGGPAGAAAAITLRARGHTVALVERSGYERERIGETLAPPVGGVLEHLGIRQFPALESYANRASWGGPELHANPFALTTNGRGWQVDRRAFDQHLAQAAEDAGADVLRAPGRGRFVIDATGRGARFATRRGARKLVEDRLVGVSGVYEHVTPGEPGVLVEACRDGWWYSATLPGERMLVCLLSDHDLTRHVALPPHTSKRVAGALAPRKRTVHSARTQRLDRVCGEDWIAAGDAAATIDPLSSQGILKALRGGIFAAYAVSDRLAGDRDAFARYARFVAAEHDENRTARATVYARERRWPAAPFWRRRLT